MKSDGYWYLPNKASLAIPFMVVFVLGILPYIIIKYFIHQLHKSLHDVFKVSQLKMNNNIYFFLPVS